MPNITPASRVAPTTTPVASTELRRFFGRIDGALDVVLEPTGSDGSFSGDVPLDSFSPPLSRAQLEGLSTRVSLPPNEAGTQAVQLVEKNGRAYLRIAVGKGSVSMLTKSPVAIAVGKAALLGQGGNVSAPEFLLQINAGSLRIDRTAPTLRMELEARVQDARAVEALQIDVTGLRDGTSSWFGGRQLEQEHGALVARVAETGKAAKAMRGELEARFGAEEPIFRLLSMPPEVAGRTKFLAAHNAAIEAKDLLVSARDLRQSFVELSLETELPEQDAKIAGLEATVAAGVKADADVRALYAATRRENPALADAWLGTLGQLRRAPDFRVTVATAARAQDALALNEADTAQAAAHRAKNLPGALANVEALLVRMTKQLAERDARVAGLRDGSSKEVVVSAPTHAADMKVI